MKLALYTNIISPHQMPLARALVARLGADSFRYVYQHDLGERAKIGWGDADVPVWVTQDRSICETAEVLLIGVRDLALMERRTKRGLITLYSSERWFKPPFGMLRLFHPCYWMMAWRMARLLKGKNGFFSFPMGVWAATDMARLVGLFSFHLGCLFRAPNLVFERIPGGRVSLAGTRKEMDADPAQWTAESAADRLLAWLKEGMASSLQKDPFALSKFFLWGYFVAPSSWSPRDLDLLRETHRSEIATGKRPLRVLWVGRFLALKRVDTLFHAVASCVEKKFPVECTFVGTGPEEARLKAMAKDCPAVYFHPPVPIHEVRDWMRSHDLYVLPSNGYEGWGAVVSEALAERMEVMGTMSAGAPATLLPKNLFQVGDAQALARMIERLLTEEIGWRKEMVK